MDLSGRRQHFALDFDTTASTHTHADSSEEGEAWAGADFSDLHHCETMRHFLAASDYCFGYSDSDDEGIYVPAHECFHVGLGMPSTGDEDEGAGNHTPLPQGMGDAAPSCTVPPAARSENLAVGQLRHPDLVQLRELQAKVKQDRLLLQ